MLYMVSVKLSRTYVYVVSTLYLRRKMREPQIFPPQ